MTKDILSETFAKFESSLYANLTALAIVDLRYLLYIIQISILENTDRLQKNLGRDTNAMVALNGLDRPLISISANIETKPSLDDNPEDVIEFYRNKWSDPDISPDIILRILSDSIRSTTGSLFARIDLIRNSIDESTKEWYDNLVRSAEYLRNTRQTIIKYSQGDE